MASNFIKYILIFITSVTLYAQEGFDWNEPSFITTDLGGDTRGNSVMDNQGNLFVIGLFEDEVSIGDTILYSSIEDGVFLAKYDVDHDLLWTKVLAVAKRDNANLRRVLDNPDIKVDEEGFIYPIIHYLDTAYFLNQQFTVDQSVVSYHNGIIIKLNSNGQFERFHHISGSCPMGIGDILVNNGIYFSIGFGPHDTDILDSCSCVINSDTTIYPFNTTTIIGRLNETDGNIEWKNLVSTESSAPSITELGIIDSSFYLSGKAGYSADLIYKNDTMIVSGGFSQYIFLMKLDLYGDYEWFTYAGVKGWDSYINPTSMIINTNNDILLSANHKSYSTMNEIFFQNSTSLVGKAENDVSYMIVNYDSLGNIKWKDLSNSIGHEHHGNLTVDSSHNIYSIQYFQGLLVFGNDSINSLNQSSDILITSYEQNGAKRWSNTVSGSGSEYGVNLHLDNDENIHIFGTVSTNNNVSFGSSNYLSPIGGSFFIAKMTKHPLDIIDYSPQQFDVLLFPNPSSGNITIEAKDEELFNIEILSYDGKLINNLNFTEPQSKIQIDGLKSNLYFFNIYTKSGKRVVYKVLVE